MGWHGGGNERNGMNWDGIICSAWGIFQTRSLALETTGNLQIPWHNTHKAITITHTHRQLRKVAQAQKQSMLIKPEHMTRCPRVATAVCETRLCLSCPRMGYCSNRPRSDIKNAIQIKILHAWPWNLGIRSVCVLLKAQWAETRFQLWKY